MFVQPGAKLNSVYYCENALEQGLLPAIRRISNNDFVFQSSRTQRRARHSPHCRLQGGSLISSIREFRAILKHFHIRYQRRILGMKIEDWSNSRT